MTCYHGTCCMWEHERVITNGTVVSDLSCYSPRRGSECTHRQSRDVVVLRCSLDPLIARDVRMPPARDPCPRSGRLPVLTGVAPSQDRLTCYSGAGSKTVSKKYIDI